MSVKIYTSQLAATYTLIDLRAKQEGMQIIEEAVALPLFSVTDILQIEKWGYIDKKSKELLAVAVEKIECFLEAQPNLTNLILICHDGRWISRFAWDVFRLKKEVLVFQHGIKGIKRWIRNTLSSSFEYFRLMGVTGVGKTEILNFCKQQYGVQCIDFEYLARHKGSVFGNIKNLEQPSQLQFELSIASALKKMDESQPVLVEYEPGNLGQVCIPMVLNDKITQGKTIWLNRNIRSRINELVKNYAGQNDANIKQGIQTLQPRLGIGLAAHLLASLNKKDYETVAAALLAYYDQTRLYAPIENPDFTIEVNSISEASLSIAEILGMVGKV
jgi:tRNA 2-selenouridine synthase